MPLFAQRPHPSARIVETSRSFASPDRSTFSSGFEVRKCTNCPRVPIGMCAMRSLHCLVPTGRVCPCGAQCIQRYKPSHHGSWTFRARFGGATGSSRSTASVLSQCSGHEPTCASSGIVRDGGCRRPFVYCPCGSHAMHQPSGPGFATSPVRRFNSRPRGRSK